MSPPLVQVRLDERDAGRIAYVTVDNAESRNALGRRGKEELIAAFRSLAHDETLRAAVLTGAGDKSFIAGANLKEMGAAGIEDAEDISTKTHLACDAIRRLPVPVIARVNGYCLGAGMELAASCDMRISVDTARFGMPEVKFGIPSGMEACLLPGLIGWGKTRELVLTGEMIDAQEAYRCGFLEQLVPAVELEEKIGKSIRLRFRCAKPARRKPARQRSPSAHNAFHVHAGFLLPGRRPRSGRVVSGISGQFPSNLIQPRKRSTRFPAPRPLRGVFSVRQLRRCRAPGDRSVAG